MLTALWLLSLPVSLKSDSGFSMNQTLQFVVITQGSASWRLLLAPSPRFFVWFFIHTCFSLPQQPLCVRPRSDAEGAMARDLESYLHDMANK